MMANIENYIGDLSPGRYQIHVDPFNIDSSTDIEELRHIIKMSESFLNIMILGY